jgi:hypothetical protein
MNTNYITPLICVERSPLSVWDANFLVVFMFVGDRAQCGVT